MFKKCKGFFKEDNYRKLYFIWETEEGLKGDEIEYPVSSTIKEEYRYTHGGHIYKQIVNYLLDLKDNFKDGDKLEIKYIDNDDKNKIIIKVNRGLVETVYSDLKELDIEILDEDNINDDYEEQRDYLREKSNQLVKHRII